MPQHWIQYIRRRTTKGNLKTRGATQLGVNRNRKRNAGVWRKLTGKKSAHLHLIPFQQLKPEETTTNHSRPKCVSKESNNGNGWASTVGSFRIGCPCASNNNSGRPHVGEIKMAILVRTLGGQCFTIVCGASDHRDTSFCMLAFVLMLVLLDTGPHYFGYGV